MVERSNENSQGDHNCDVRSANCHFCRHFYCEVCQKDITDTDSNIPKSSMQRSFNGFIWLVSDDEDEDDLFHVQSESDEQ